MNLASACFWLCISAVLLAVVFGIQGMAIPCIVSCFVAIGSFFVAIEVAGEGEEQ